MACENGHSKIAEMLIQKSAELNIDLNAKHRLFDRTAFHLAYENGHFIKLLRKLEWILGLIWTHRTQIKGS